MGRTVTYASDPDAPAVLSETDREYHDGPSDEKLKAAARADPDNPPATATMAARAEAAHAVRRVRADTGLSQARFAACYGFSAAAVRDWEQGRRTPEASTLCYLRVIEREPQAVSRALATG